MNEHISKILSSKWSIPTCTGITGVGIGLSIGYIWGKRNGDVFEVFLDESERAQLNLFDDWSGEKHEAQEEVGATTPDDHPQRAIDAFTSAEAHEAWQKLEKESETVTRSVFPDEVTEWNNEAELSTRTPDEPYIITVDEYIEDEMGFSQSTVTYYEGDQILCDEMNVPIYNHDMVTGPLKFGHGTNDPNVVYIRNEKLQIEYEVLRHTGHFQIEVQGLEIEEQMAADDLKHSRQPRRYRDD